MLICEVIGHVWATKKEENLNGTKLMVVRRSDFNGVKKGSAFNNEEEDFVAVDVVGAGIGEHVLVVSGSTARKALGSDNVPADAAIVGIIDSVEIIS